MGIKCPKQQILTFMCRSHFLHFFQGEEWKNQEITRLWRIIHVNWLCNLISYSVLQNLNLTSLLVSEKLNYPWLGKAKLQTIWRNQQDQNCKISATWQIKLPDREKTKDHSISNWGLSGIRNSSGMNPQFWVILSTQL